MNNVLCLILCCVVLSGGQNMRLVRADEHNCNEFVCGSIVSKCLLTQSCQCKLTDCYCCQDCRHCLSDLYNECCGCLDMCPTQNTTLGALTPKSQVGNFEGVPELFEALTTDEDDEEWTVLRFPMRTGLRRPFDLAAATTDAIDRQASLQKQRPYAPTSSSPSALAGVNCTVIYLHNCQRNEKCVQYCESMGASSYRWFHDGCCQCVGAHCINYGINESRCTACPEPESLEVDEVANEDIYAGDNDDTDDSDNAKVVENAGNNEDNDEEDDEELWTYGEDEINYN